MGNEIKKGDRLFQRECNKYIQKFPYSGSQDPRWKEMGVQFYDIGDKYYVGVKLPEFWSLEPDTSQRNRVYILYDEYHREIANIYQNQTKYNKNSHVQLNKEAVNLFLEEKKWREKTIKKSKPKEIPKIDERNLKDSRISNENKSLSYGLNRSSPFMCNNKKIKIYSDFQKQQNRVKN